MVAVGVVKTVFVIVFRFFVEHVGNGNWFSSALQVWMAVEAITVVGA